jgi:SAM-dependent methyltransferase
MRAVCFILLIAFSFFGHAQEVDGRAPFITTPADVVERMLRLAGTSASDLVVDLGSGDGRIVIDAARKFGARGLGIELDPGLVQKSRDNARQANVAERVSFVHGDVLLTDISQASVVTVYLLPSLIGRLQPRFLDELKPGTRVVSHAFYMTSWKPDRIEKMRIAQRHEGQGDESTIYLWIVPAKARGLWEGEPGAAGRWRLRIHQNFQEIEVEAQLDGRAVPVAKASLSGNEITWEGKGVRFTGRVEGARIAGELARDGRSSPVILSKKP